MLYKLIIRPFLFGLNPEKAHYFTTDIFKFILKVPLVKTIFFRSYDVKSKYLEREVFGLRFKNPVGLAAGFDKNASMYDSLQHLGFGFIEIGTVTPKAQPGNDQPRMFRLKADEALINRMGFNNLGADEVVKNLKNRNPHLIIGGNIGKNKITPNEKAVDDYLVCFEKLFDVVDYFVVNVSSPNTPNLRELQEKEPLTQLLETLQIENNKKKSPKPILLKIAPDLTYAQLDDIIEIAQKTNLAGLIATNTTISRENLKSPENLVQQTGGLSGKPVREQSTKVIAYLRNKLGQGFPIIGVGGIFNAQDAIEKFEAGATLVQVYTGFVYEGPAMIKNINTELISYFKNKHNE